jgi:hypothetical protein
MIGRIVHRACVPTPWIPSVGAFLKNLADVMSPSISAGGCADVDGQAVSRTVQEGRARRRDQTECGSARCVELPLSVVARASGALQRAAFRRAVGPRCVQNQ